MTVDVLGLVGRTVEQVRFDACVDSGGFGLIYRGYHAGLGEVVAIKCLRIGAMQKTDESTREALAGRFRDETKLLYRLSQGNLDIVRCIGSGTIVVPTTNEITPYMVLEWLDGCTLSAELGERREQKLPPRTLEQTVELMDSAALAIAYAHENDVVHRDVKPGNLFITRTRDGIRMKVLDFGLAKILSDETIGFRPSVETAAGVHFCSPSYGAPEQFSRTIGNVGPWTDVYSLALVILEVMTNTKVRPATTLADGMLKSVDPKSGSPTASSLGLKIPKAAEALLHRAVAKDPKDRPRDAGVFWSELKEAMKSATSLSSAAQSAGRLGATVADDRVLDAMQQVREEVARASVKPSPFTGTMLMQDAPRLPPPAATPAPSTAPMAPARSLSPAAGLQLTMPLGATSPLAATGIAPASLAPRAPQPGSVPPPGLTGPPPPMTGPPPPMSAPPQDSPYAVTRSQPVVRPPNLASVPAAPAAKAPAKGFGVILGVVVAIVVLIAGGALYMMMGRAH
ncbi:MAG: serine/threonine protein kinase [Labilithrix sp.]|nr:serine/threonine protein kinase [Labilithrix sp.]